MIGTILTISGVRYEDYKNLTVQRTTSEHTASSNFTAFFDSPFGRHDDDFNVGDNIKIFAAPHILSAYYKFNTETGSVSTDYLELNNGSIISGTSSRLVAGQLGSAYQFGSPSFFRQDVLDPSRFSTLSVAFWMNTTLDGQDDSLIVNQRDSTTNGFFFNRKNSSKVVEFVTRSGGTTTMTIDTGSISVGDWHHVVGTINNNAQIGYIYLNGSLVGSDTSAFMRGVNSLSTAPLTIGKAADTNLFYYSGLVDDVRIYSTEIDLNEVRRIYNNGSGLDDKFLFNGIVEEVGFIGEGTKQEVGLRGKDYTARIMDVTVEPVVYTNSEVSTIVNNILANEVVDIGSINVNITTTTLPRIAFNHVTVYDAFKQLAELSGFIFYVDEDQDLHFERKESNSSNQTFNNTNVLSCRFDRTREDFHNQVWVYGDRQLIAAPTERLNVGSPNDGGSLGSVFTLIYRPHNTQVSILGSIRIGGVWNMTSSTSPASGTAYLVNYFDRQLIFPSGTTFGYYLPASGGSIVVNYEREVPIGKFGEDDASVLAFGPKEKIIIDKSIRDPQTARDIVVKELAKADPPRKIEIDFDGWGDFKPGQTATINIPNFNLNNRTTSILDVNYNLTPETVQTDQVISLSLDNKIVDLTDHLVELNKRLSLIEAQDASDTDTITRIKFLPGSLTVVGSYWEVRTNSSTGSVSYLYSTNFTPPRSPFNLASGTTAGSLAGGNFVGSAVAYSAFTVQSSGGYSGY